MDFDAAQKNNLDTQDGLWNLMLCQNKNIDLQSIVSITITVFTIPPPGAAAAAAGAAAAPSAAAPAAAAAPIAAVAAAGATMSADTPTRPLSPYPGPSGFDIVNAPPYVLFWLPGP